MKVEMMQSKDLLIEFDSNNKLKDGRIILSYQEALDLLDSLENELWDEPTHRDLESKTDQLEYELQSVKGELDYLRECGNKKYRDW